MQWLEAKWLFRVYFLFLKTVTCGSFKSKSQSFMEAEVSKEKLECGVKDLNSSLKSPISWPCDYSKGQNLFEL